tara:strand:+ start:495 stop:1481 length:987 start_codon:yes stop_codon:yes gene_type:complete
MSTFLEMIGIGGNEDGELQGIKEERPKKKAKGFTQLNNEIRDLLKQDPETRSIKDFNKLLGDISFYNARGGVADIPQSQIDKLNIALNAQFPDRGKDDLTKRQIMQSPFFEGSINVPFEDDFVKLALLQGKEKKAEKEAEASKKDLGFFGKMIDKLQTDADARQRFFDQLGGIGAEISRPTEPGEARSLARDLIVGSEQGEKRSIAKRKAEAETMADVALARQRANPMQYYTTAMKELTQQAIAAGLTPGTPPFTTYIGEKLRGKGLSANLASYSETLKNLNEQLLQAQAAGQDPATIIQQIKDVQGLITAELGGTSGASSDIPYNPQ